MKRYIFLIPLVFLTQLASAQGLKSEESTTTNAVELRAEANFTKHFTKQGVNLYGSEAIYSRLYDSANEPSYFRRSYTTLGVSYAPIHYLRLGGEYTLKIYGNKFTSTKSGTTVANPASKFLRHRATFFVTGQYTYQDWKFSLRERLDANFRTDSVNLHEKPQVELLLRHKIQAQYSIPGKPVKVSSYVELWNTLNQPVKYLNTYAGVDKNGNATAYAGKSFGQYLSEVRAQAGVRWRVDKRNTLGLAYRFTYGYSRDINIIKDGKTNAGFIELTNAKSYGHYIILSYDLDW